MYPMDNRPNLHLKNSASGLTRFQKKEYLCAIHNKKAMHPILFVSLGPGEAELITLKGLKALQAAQHIFCPETQTKDGRTLSRAADIMTQLHIPQDIIHRFTLPMSKQREKALAVYHRVHTEAAVLAQEGKRVCIVAEGDAGFYSSIHYVYEKLAADGMPVEHIAGIPAFIAAGARGGLAVTSQEERLTVIPGTTTAEEIERLMGEKHAVVVMKLSQCTNEIHRCIRLHPEYSYHYFENVGTAKEMYLNDTERIKAILFPYFSLLVIRPNGF